MNTLKIGRHKAVFEYPNAKPEIIFKVDKAKSTDSEKNDPSSPTTPTKPTTPTTNGNVSVPQANDKTTTQSNGTQSTIKDTSAKTNNSTNMLLAIMFVMLSGGFIALNTIKKGYKNK